MAKPKNESLLIIIVVIVAVIIYFYFFFIKDSNNSMSPYVDMQNMQIANTYKAPNIANDCSNFKINDYINTTNQWQLMIVDANLGTILNTLNGCNAIPDNMGRYILKCNTIPKNSPDSTLIFRVIDDNIIIAEKILNVDQTQKNTIQGLVMKLLFKNKPQDIPLSIQVPLAYGASLKNTVMTENWFAYLIPVGFNC
jgi:hypothetical protein